jgi:predicted O-methyltransferase YrrM
MSDEELVGFAKRFIEASGITGRKELKKADSGLHKALRTRKLIDAVFVPIEQKKQDEMIEQLAEAVDAYTKI